MREGWSIAYRRRRVHLVYANLRYSAILGRTRRARGVAFVCAIIHCSATASESIPIDFRAERAHDADSFGWAGLDVALVGDGSTLGLHDSMGDNRRTT